MNFHEINELYLDDFLSLTRDAVIYKFSQSEAGQEYLDKCWVMEQTKPDRKALREKFRKEE